MRRARATLFAEVRSRMRPYLLACLMASIPASARRGCVARMGEVGALTPAPASSGDADVGRASQIQHAVEDMDGDVHLGRPTLIRMRAQPVANHLFPSANGGLGPGAFRVAGRRLPGHPALLGNK